MVQKNEQSKSEMKSTDELLMVVFFKIVNGDPLTESEQKFYDDNPEKVEELTGKASGKKSELKKKKADKAEKEQDKKFRKFLAYFKLSLKQFVDVDPAEVNPKEMKNWLKDQVRNVPVLHGGSGNSNWDSPVSQSKLQKDVEDVKNGKKDHTYWSAIYKIVSENNGELDRDGVEKELAKIFPDRVNTAAGLGYRVYQATKKFSGFMAENEKGKLEITES